MARLSTQTIGLAAAAGVAIALGAIVLFFIVQGAGPAAPRDRDDDDPPAPALVPGGLRADDAPAAAGRAGVLQFMDRDDPERLQSELVYDTIEPTGVQRYAVGQPRAWIYQRDGSAVHVRADRGDFVMVGQQDRRPEAGVLAGSVLIRAYDAETIRELVGSIDPDDLAPALTARVERLEFDFTVNEIATDDRLEIVTPEFDFVGTGVRALYSEIRERIERLEIHRDSRLVYTPAARGMLAAADAPAPTLPPTGAAQPAPDRAAPPPAPATAQREDAPPAPGAAPREQFYAVDIAGPVRIEQPGRRIEADRLELWGRLVGNRFAPGAFGEQAAAPSALPSYTPHLAPLPMLAALAHAAAQSSAEPQDALADRGRDADFSNPITATWSGPLVLRPLAGRPGELTHDDAALRMTAAPGTLRFRDDELRVEGSCDELQYAATRRELVLIAAQDGGVDVSAEGAGRITGSRLEAGLATGLAHVPTPGELRGLGGTGLAGGARDADRESRIAWGERADFTFRTDNGRATGDLEQATFAGDVRATDGRAEIAGGFLRADFERTDRTATALRRLVVRENAAASDGRGGTLHASELVDVAFDEPRNPETREAFDPTTLLARGSVRVERGEQSLESEMLEAQLYRDDSGSIEIDRVFAQGGVRVTGEDGVRGGAERLIARVPTQEAELIGDDAFLAVRETRIEGGAIELDGLARTVEIIGAGRFVRTPTETSAGAQEVEATWLGRMFFDDLSGLLEASGDVEARAEVAGVSRDTIAADRVRALLTPAEADRGAPGFGAGFDAGLGDGERRELRSFVATSETPGERVRVESRGFEGGRVTRILYLEGEQVEGDAETDTLDVPGPGRLFIRDLQGAEASPDRGAGGGIARGDALFDWDGRMHFDRAADRFELQRRVRLTHRRAGDGEITDLECERLTGRLRDDEAPDTGGSRLREAIATGAVYLRSGGREVVADELFYDADRGQARAAAARGNRLSMFDGSAGTAVTAEGLVWDLTTGRIDLSRPGPITTPR